MHIFADARSEEDNWCCDENSIDVDVGALDVKGVKFVQKGYWVNVIFIHDVDCITTLHCKFVGLQRL